MRDMRRALRQGLIYSTAAACLACCAVTLAQEIVGDAYWEAGAFHGTDNSPAIEARIKALAPAPWGAGKGGTLELPAGFVGITRPIMLPRTLQGYYGMPSQAVRIRGEGSNTTTLVYLGDSISKHDFVIGWEPFHLPVTGFSAADDGKTWVHFADDLFKFTCHRPSHATRYSVVIFEGETSYPKRPAEHKVLDRDLKGKRAKIDTPFIAGTEKETPTMLGYVRAIQQRIEGVYISCPRKPGAVGIYHGILSHDNWRKSTFRDYNYCSVWHQRISLDLRDVAFGVRAQFNPACIRVEGSWFGSMIEDVHCYGQYGPPYNYDTYVIDCDWEMPSGREVPARVAFDGNGFQRNVVRNVFGGNFSAFRGRMNATTWDGGFYSGGGRQKGHEATTGLPVWDLRNSFRSRISFVGHEGQAEKPAEFYCEDSVEVKVRYYTGGGANEYEHTRPPDRELGDMIQFKHCWNCGVEKRYAGGKSYGYMRRIKERFASNPGASALLRFIDCSGCYAEGFDFDVMPVNPKDPFCKDLPTMVNLMIRIDAPSSRKGCYAAGTAWLTAGSARQEKHTYENRDGKLMIDGIGP